MGKMSKKELEKFKKLLLKERENILKEVGRITEDTLKKPQRDASGEVSGYTLHMADVATDNYDREFSLGIADAERQTLIRIDEALKRIEENNYGKCLSCGKDISKKRLMALSFAEYCKACQEKEESQKRV